MYTIPSLQPYHTPYNHFSEKKKLVFFLREKWAICTKYTDMIRELRSVSLKCDLSVFTNFEIWEDNCFWVLIISVGVPINLVSAISNIIWAFKGETWIFHFFNNWLIKTMGAVLVVPIDGTVKLFWAITCQCGIWAGISLNSSPTKPR